MVEDANPTTPQTSTAPPDSTSTFHDGDTELEAIEAVPQGAEHTNRGTAPQGTWTMSIRVRSNAAGPKARAPISATQVPAIPEPTPPTSSPGQPKLPRHQRSTTSARLRETKDPKSAIEMAALVAYYVSELAPAADRRNEITKSDIERYFKAAGFNLPADAGFTLVNAKNAGYLDSAGPG